MICARVYDAYVVDLELDDSSEGVTKLGIQVIEALSMDRPNVPIVFSAHDDCRSVLQAMRHGAIDFVPKGPEGLTVLRETVEKVLRTSVDLNAELRKVEKVLEQREPDPDARFLVFSDGDLVCHASTPFVALAEYREQRRKRRDLREDPIVIEHDPPLLEQPEVGRTAEEEGESR